jgi:U3 small nucleolar RNA-associated protein 22
LEAAPQSVSVADPLYKAPTADELRQLNEATSLYQSNIFRMEIDELLQEVKLDYDTMKPLELALKQIKSTWDAMKPVQFDTV